MSTKTFFGQASEVNTGFDASRFTANELRAMVEHVIRGGTDPQEALTRHRAKVTKQNPKRR